MASINFIIDTKGLEQKLTKLERQVLPAVRARSLSFVAQDARGTVQKVMELSLDRPIPYTRRAVRFESATVEDPVAAVYISSDPNKGIPPSTYLREHVTSGTRGQKPSERLLQRAGLLGRNEGWSPARAMRLDRYGNVPPSRLVQILSQLKAFSEVGASMNVTAASRARNKGRTQYFVPKPGSRLYRGVYERHGPRPKIKKGPRKGQPGVPRRIRPVLLFTPLPSYQQRFDFAGAVRQDVRRRLPNAWRRAMAYELRRAGMRR